MNEQDEHNLEESLVENARELLRHLEEGHPEEALDVIETLRKVRDRSLYLEIGCLTRSLHDAIKNFHMGVGLKQEDASQISRMADATERLNYVIKRTEDAANKTMDMVEDTIPISANLGGTAASLREEWGRLQRREISPDRFRSLYREIDDFLGVAANETGRIGDNLSTILLAQDYQDLTGQVLKKVIALVQEVEENLVKLVRMASKVEAIAGIKYVPDNNPVVAANEAEGPIVNAAERDDVVTGQDEVDDLLSSLGF